MQIIQNNPYRTVGLLVGASAAEQRRQLTRLQRFLEADQEPDDDFSFPTLGRHIHRTLESVNEASSKLNLDSEKMNAALFWFYNGNGITDDAAFEAIKEGNTDAAVEIWRKLVYDSEGESYNEVTKRNAPAFHNLSTFYLQEYKIDEDTLQLKLLFLESDYFNELKNKATDETFIISKNEIQILFLNSLIHQEEIDTSEFIDVILNLEFIAKDEFLKSFAQKPIEQIEHKIETAKNIRKASKANGATAGQELFAATASDLTQLKSIVGGADLKYTSIADKVANEILQCSIDYFNDSQEKDSSSDYTEIAMKLAKQAENIDVGNLTKDRIKETINSLEEMKDKELSQAIQLLQSVKEAYETNERKIRAEVRRIEETDIQIKLRYRTINWSAVEDNIKNSINWEEVNKLLISILPENNLKKIKESDKSEEKKEFLELANWLKEKSKRASTITTIIDKYKKIPPKLPFKIVSSIITNTDKNSNPLPVTNPLYKKHTRYVGLKINVECNEGSSITIYKKYISPSGEYSSNDKFSPKGYTSSITATIYSSTKVIDLSGWGNSDSCTFEIGKHRIEVYIYEYLIYSTEFIIDLAPSEKLEIEIKKAEGKLSEIKNFEYFKSELEMAKNEMNEIQKFQLFRSSSTKQLQISEQERKILNIKQKAETEKKQQVEKQNKVIEKLKSDLQIAEY